MPMNDDRYLRRDGSAGTTKKAKRSVVHMNAEEKEDDDSQITVNSVKDEILNGQMSMRCNSSLFVFKLFEMATTEEYAPAIGFSMNGLSLELRDTEALVPVLLKYFKHSNVSSFIRQLNNYGFKTISSGPHLQSFAHPQFFREGKDCLDLITRRSAKASSKSKVDLIKDIQDGENEYRKQIHALETAYKDLLHRNQILQTENDSLRHLRGELVGRGTSNRPSAISNSIPSENNGSSRTHPIPVVGLFPASAVSRMPVSSDTVHPTSASRAIPPPSTSVGALGFPPVAFNAMKLETGPYQQLFPNQPIPQTARNNASTGLTMTTDDDGEFLESLIVMNDEEEED